MSAINYTHGKRMQIIINEFSLSKKKKKKKKHQKGQQQYPYSNFLRCSSKNNLLIKT